jgi:hypothetical protein
MAQLLLKQLHRQSDPLRKQPDSQDTIKRGSDRNKVSPPQPL